MHIGIVYTTWCQIEKKCCPTKRSAHHIHFDKTMHDIFLGFSEVKNAFLSHRIVYMLKGVGSAISVTFSAKPLAC